MGWILFGVVVVLQVLAVGWNLKTGMVHKKEAGITTFIFLGAFLVLCLTNVIQWSFRYYFFFGLLLIWGLCRIRFFVQKKKNPTLGKRAKLIAKAIGACALCFFTLVPAIVFPQYKAIAVTGKNTVNVQTATFVDESRIETYDDSGNYREVNVEFWYPKEQKEGCPLVVFSHGFNGIKMSNVSLFQELASEGYVVCSIDHPYQSYFTRDESGKITLISSKYGKQYQLGTTTEDKKEVYQYISEWMNIREADISFVIDTILQKGQQADSEEWYHMIDPSKIAVTGHSLGGAAALGIGRHRDDITAVVALESPYMSDILGVDEKQDAFIWEDTLYPVPVLAIYSDCTWGQFSMSPLYDENQRELDNPGSDSYYVHIAGAGHLELTDLSLISPLLTHMLDDTSKLSDSTEVLETVNEETLHFLDYYMKGIGDRPVSKENVELQ